MKYRFNRDIIFGYNQGRLVISDSHGLIPALYCTYTISTVFYALTSYDDTETQVRIVSRMNQWDQEKGEVVLQLVIKKYAHLFDHDETSMSRDKTEKVIDPMKLKPGIIINPDNLKLDYPTSLVIIPTWRCNGSCIYCGVPKIPPAFDERQIPFEVLEKRVKEAVNDGVMQVNIHGGEPLFYADKRIYELIKWLTNRAVYVYISTKNMITDQIGTKLQECGISEIQLSFDTIDDEAAHKMNYGDYYKHVLEKSIQNLLEHKILPRVNIVATSVNIDTIPSTIRYLSSLGVGHIGISEFRRNRFSKDYSPSIEQKRKLIEGINQLDIKTELDNGCGLIQSVNGKAVCEGGRNSLVIFPDGNCSICDFLVGIPEFQIGNIMRESIEDIWNSKRCNSIVFPDVSRLNNTKCETCEGKNICLSRGFCFSNGIMSDFYFPDRISKECEDR